MQDPKERKQLGGKEMAPDGRAVTVSDSHTAAMAARRAEGSRNSGVRIEHRTVAWAQTVVSHPLTT